MKKTYESTIDEAVNASFRIAEMAGTVQKQLWYGFIWILIIPPLVYMLFNRPYYPRLAMPLVFAVVLTVVHLLTYRDQMRKRIRKILVKALGTDQPVRSEYEINEDGLAFRKMGQEVRFSWSNVTDIIKTTHSIEVHMKPSGIAILPKRIFESDQELQDWLSFIENHRTIGCSVRLAPPENRNVGGLKDIMEPIQLVSRTAKQFSIVVCLIGALVGWLLTFVIVWGLVEEQTLYFNGKPIWIGAMILGWFSFALSWMAFRLIRRPLPVEVGTMMPRWFVIANVAFFVVVIFVAMIEKTMRLIEK